MSGSPDPRQALERLLDHFEQNLYAIKSPQYNETQARREFIDPFFTLLGRDMDNRHGYAESAKGKRGTTEADKAFLQEIEAWRDALARNPNLTTRCSRTS